MGFAPPVDGSDGSESGFNWIPYDPLSVISNGPYGDVSAQIAANPLQYGVTRIPNDISPGTPIDGGGVYIPASGIPTFKSDVSAPFFTDFPWLWIIVGIIALLMLRDKK